MACYQTAVRAPSSPLAAASVHLHAQAVFTSPSAACDEGSTLFPFVTGRACQFHLDSACVNVWRRTVLLIFLWLEDGWKTSLGVPNLEGTSDVLMISLQRLRSSCITISCVLFILHVQGDQLCGCQQDFWGKPRKGRRFNPRPGRTDPSTAAGAPLKTISDSFKI